MLQTRVIGFVVLTAVVITLTVTTQAVAADTKVFAWNTYTKNGKMYSYPEWAQDAKDNTKVYLSNAVGVIQPPANYKVTKAVMKVYKPSAGAPGSYETTPTLTLTSNNPLALLPSGYQVAWGDDGIPKKLFATGITVKIEIRVTYQNVNNAQDTFEADLPTQYSETTPAP